MFTLLVDSVMPGLSGAEPHREPIRRGQANPTVSVADANATHLGAEPNGDP
jgi:hypothetical protein